jgi:hypothetical protein
MMCGSFARAELTGGWPPEPATIALISRRLGGVPSLNGRLQEE